MHKLTEEGKQLLLQVAEDAAAHPEHFDMGYILRNLKDRELPELVNNEFSCGAVGCLAGWLGIRLKMVRSDVRLSCSEQAELPAKVMQRLCGEYDRDLAVLFNMYPADHDPHRTGITADNVVECVKTFIEGGLDPLLELFELEPEDRRPLISKSAYYDYVSA